MPTWLIPRQDLSIEQLRAVEAPADQHQLFVGGPGSGKTQVLLHRADYLRRTLGIAHERIQIFVYTRVLKDYLRSALQLLDLPETCVTTLDSWCSDYYRKNIGGPLPRDASAKSPNFAEIRKQVKNHLRDHPKHRPFDYALVDEGQDLDINCYKLLKKAAQNVTVCMDHNQQIYDSGSKLDEVLKKLDLPRQNLSFLETFRCSPYIVETASRFIDEPKEREHFINQTRTTTTDIETPVYYRSVDWEDTMSDLIDTVGVRLARGEKIAILLPQKRQVYGYANGFREAGIPVETPNEVDFNTDTPKIMPYHSAKGLTFDTVFLPNLSSNGFGRVSPARVRRLLFVGMTRATGWIYMSKSETANFAPLNDLNDLIEQKRITIRTQDDHEPPSSDNSLGTQIDDDIEFL